MAQNIPGGSGQTQSQTEQTKKREPNFFKVQKAKPAPTPGKEQAQTEDPSKKPVDADGKPAQTPPADANTGKDEGEGKKPDGQQPADKAKPEGDGDKKPRQLTEQEARDRLKKAEDDLAVRTGDLSTLARGSEQLLKMLEDQGFDVDELAEKANVDLGAIRRVKDKAEKLPPAVRQNKAMEAAVAFDEQFFGKVVNGEDGKPKVGEDGLIVRKGGIKHLVDKAEGSDTTELVETFAALMAMDPELQEEFVNADPSDRLDMAMKRGKAAKDRFGTISVSGGGLLGSLERERRENAKLKDRIAELEGPAGSKQEGDSEDDGDDETVASDETQKGKRPSLSSARASQPSDEPVRKKSDVSKLFGGR